MRIYQFFCELCEARFEQPIPRGEAPRLMKCPMCRQSSRRVVPLGNAATISGEVATAFSGGCCGGEYGCGARGVRMQGAYSGAA